MGAEDAFSSNAASYTQRQVTQEQLRATQEELAAKVRELQIYESNYIQLKKDLARWKKKFEYIFRENELLSLETAKLDASHKQIAFLQQEIKFKEEESSALRGLVSALEASNKKARVSRLDAASARLANQQQQQPPLATNSSSSSSNSNSAHTEANNDALERERLAFAAERERLDAEIAALKSENSLLLKDVDRKELALQLKDDAVAAHKDRIASLEVSLTDEQQKHLTQLRDKQDAIVDLEVTIHQMEMRRRSSAAFYAPPLRTDQVTSDETSASASATNDVGFGPTDRLRTTDTNGNMSDHHSDATNEHELPDTPPGTPPPISAGGLLPPPDDPLHDQIVRDWTVDKKVRAASSTTMEAEQLDAFLDKLPFESKDGTRRILWDALVRLEDDDDDNDADDDDANAIARRHHPQIAESQILIQNVSSDTQRDLQDVIIPLLKAHKTMRVTYATRQRKTVVTDVRMTLEPRPSSVTGVLGPEEKRFGKTHAFLGPAADGDVSKLVLHGPRTLTTEKKALYVSKAIASTASTAAASPSTPSDDGQRSSSLEALDSPMPLPLRGAVESDGHGPSDSPAAADNVTTTNRLWRGMSVPSAIAVGKTAKLLGTMAAGAKQRVAAKFANSKFAHDNTACQFCKTSPIVGARYACATCVGFDLCENCYALGGHGLENSDEMFYRVQELVLARCVRLVDEIDLLELLRFEICRSNLRKFTFCLNWLADIIAGKTSRDLQARALEIPSIRRDVRKRFVPLLMIVCSDRDDIEVKTEWELESDNAAQVHSVVRGSLGDGDGKFLETLRIWVADQYRTTSPFMERNLLQYNDGIDAEDEEVESGESDEKTNKLALKPPLVQKKSSKTLDVDGGVDTNVDANDSATSKQGFLERNHIQSSDEF